MIGDHGLERRAMPEIERIDRLHIIVTIEQDVRPCAAVSFAVAFSDDGRMPRGRFDLTGKSERSDIPGKMICRRLAISGKGRIGRDRFDAQ
jgi:hypothetical protein